MALNWLVDLVTVLLAVVFMPAMLWDVIARSRREAGKPTPTSIELAAWLVGMAAPWAAWGRWLVLRVLQPSVPRATPTPPRADDAPDCATLAPEDDDDAPDCATLAPIPPGNRAALIEALVAAEWSVGQIRATLKGDNGAIGQEVEAARQRLGMPAPRRVVTISNGKQGEVEL